MHITLSVVLRRCFAVEIPISFVGSKTDTGVTSSTFPVDSLKVETEFEKKSSLCVFSFRFIYFVRNSWIIYYVTFAITLMEGIMRIKYLQTILSVLRVLQKQTS